MASPKPQPDIATPSFGYKSSIVICRRFGFIRNIRPAMARALMAGCCATW